MKEYLENRFQVSYSGYSWILTQIRNYEEEIGFRLFEKVPRITSYNVCYTKLLRTGRIAALERQSGAARERLKRLEAERVRQRAGLMQQRQALGRELRASYMAGRSA